MQWLELKRLGPVCYYGHTLHACSSGKHGISTALRDAQRERLGTRLHCAGVKARPEATAATSAASSEQMASAAWMACRQRSDQRWASPQPGSSSAPLAWSWATWMLVGSWAAACPASASAALAAACLEGLPLGFFPSAAWTLAA